MKKLMTLSAILVMSLSSFVFAADDVPPPPKHPVTHDGKNADHQKKDGKEWKHGKKDNRDAPPPKHNGKALKHDGEKPPLPPADKR